MPETLQHKMQQYEMPPPEGGWNAIAALLDEGFDKTEQSIARKLDQYDMTPPAGAFQSIMLELEAPEKKAAPVRTLSYRKWIAAAAVLLLLAGGWWLWPVGKSPATLSANTTTPTENSASESSPAQAPESVDRASEGSSGSLVTVTPARNVSRPMHLISDLRYDQPLVDTEEKDWQAEAINDEVIAKADATPEAGIKAPLIRDANGKIIMDLSLLTTGNGNYISITGPNGEQTRISTKFAQYLMYLGGPDNKSEEYLDFLIRNSNSWKQRFQEWRARIMQSPDFIPSGLNFLDILELKELLKENQ